MNHRTCIDVLVKHDTKGIMTPCAIVWTDGSEYEVKKINMEQVRSPIFDGLAWRFLVSVKGQLRRLWYEPDERKWYIEPKVKVRHCCAHIKH